MKKGFKKFTMLILGTSLIAVPAVSCGSNNNIGNVISPEKPSIPGTPGIPSQSIVDTEIKESINVNLKSFKSMNSNDFSLTQSKDDFLANGKFEQYKGYVKDKVNNGGVAPSTNTSIDSLSQDNIQQDIYMYLFNLHKINQSISFYSPKFENNNSSNEIGFGVDTNKVDFKLELQVFATENTIFDIEGKRIVLKKGDAKTLTITASDTIIKPTLNWFVNSYYLGWSIEKATFNFDGANWEVNNLNVSRNSFSHTFKYKFLNLTNSKSYFDLKNLYEKDIYKTDSKFLQENVEKTLTQDIIKYLGYADIGNDILGVLTTNPSIDELIKKISKDIIEILVMENILPSEVKGFLVDSLTSNEPFINVIDNNRNAIKQLLASIIGDVAEVANKYIDMIKPGITENSPEYHEINQLLQILPENIKPLVSDIILKDFLGIGAPAKTLLNIVIDNYEGIFNLIGTKDKTVLAINDILKMLLTTDTQTGNLNKIFDVLFAKENKTKIVEIIKKLITTPSDNLNLILKNLIVENTALNSKNFVESLKSIHSFTNTFFEKNQNYTSIENKYKNLEIKKSFIENNLPKLDENNKSISFKYKFEITLKEEMVLNLVPLKDLISKRSLNNTVADVLLKNKDNLPIPDFAIQILPIIINRLRNSELGDVIKKILPDRLVFGGKEHKPNSTGKLSFIFESNNSKVWFKPQLIGNDYFNGFDYEYNMNISYYDANMILDITKNNGYYDGGNLETVIPDTSAYLPGLKVNMPYSELWKAIITNVLNRDYDIRMIGTTKLDSKISNSTEYNENQFYEKYQFSNNFSMVNISDIMNLMPMENKSLFKYVNGIGEDVYYQWSVKSSNKPESGAKLTNNTNAQHKKIEGIKPIITDKISNEITKEFLDLSKIDSNYYSLSIVPIFNNNINLKLGIDFMGAPMPQEINLKMFLLDTYLYFPFKVYDTTSKTHESYLKQSFSYIGM